VMAGRRTPVTCGEIALPVTKRRLYLLSSAIPYLSSVERSERNESIDNIARIAKGLQIEPWRAINPAPGDGARSYLKANYGAEAI
jgi:hypothetical protein